MWQTMLKVWEVEGGEDVAEYALLLCLLLVIVVLVVQSIGTTAGSIFKSTADTLAAALK